MNYLPDWLLWLGGTLLPLSLLWALWHLALRRERCYRYNRFLLLLAPLVAAALPLLPRPALPEWLTNAPELTAGPVAVLLPTVRASASAAIEQPTTWAGWPWLLALYGVGVALGLGKLAWQTGRLWQLARRLPRFEHGDYTLVHTGGSLPTSTFGRVVFWDETVTLAPAEATAVLAHELAHAHQRHTLDVLWLQVWRAVLWPNPFVHLLLPALRLTHELLADQAAATSPTASVPTAPTEAYTTLLARLAARQLAGPAYSLLQPFAFSSTLTRIAMLKNPHPARRWKQWLVLPTLGGLFLVACQSAPTPAMTPPPPPPPMLLGPAQAQALSDGPKIYTYVEEMPHMASGGGQVGIVNAIAKNIKYPELAADARQEGRVFVKFVVSPEGNAHSIEIVKGLAPEYDAAVVAAIQSLPAFVPGKQDGKPVSVSFTVPVSFYANK